MTPLSIIFPIALLLMAIVAEVAARGHLPRNGFVGIRIPSTLRTDEGWLAGHRAAAPVSWIGFAISMVLGGATWFVSSSWFLPLTLILAFVSVALFVTVIIVTSKAARAADLIVSR